jgi:Ca2+-binding EF-hand superfamily protein
MKDRTVIKAVLASLVILGSGIPVGHAQNLFIGMMSAQTGNGYDPQIIRDVTDRQAREMFVAMDVDKDGTVTKEEFSAAYPRYYPADGEQDLLAKRFSQLDITSSGKVSQAEFIANRYEPAAGGQ